ncbi:MAG: MBL fold metallo-hydrolase [Bacteroidetes bacterium]|nr:MBL fold metallo-hydrolase [Bacteroidota bacterium]
MQNKLSIPNNSINLKFVSTGGIFDYNIGNSAAILEHKQGRILIDCGYTVYADLCKKGMIEHIDYLLITHLHGDHVGSLHPFILHINNKNLIKQKVKLLYPTEEFKEQIHKYMTYFLIDPNNYIEYIPLSSIDGAGYIDTKDLHFKGLQTFAYYFELNNKLIYYSGDLGNIETTIKFLKNVKQKNLEIYHEISFKEGNAHVYYKEIMIKLSDVNVFGYHCNHTQAPVDNTIKLVGDLPECLL